jgi:ketosteroid isomerase-like protein
MSDAEKKAIAEQFLAGLRNRDWESLRATMADDIVWSLPGGSVISGIVRLPRLNGKALELFLSKGNT